MHRGKIRAAQATVSGSGSSTPVDFSLTVPFTWNGLINAVGSGTVTATLLCAGQVTQDGDVSAAAGGGASGSCALGTAQSLVSGDVLSVNIGPSNYNYLTAGPAGISGFEGNTALLVVAGGSNGTSGDWLTIGNPGADSSSGYYGGGGGGKAATISGGGVNGADGSALSTVGTGGAGATGAGNGGDTGRAGTNATVKGCSGGAGGRAGIIYGRGTTNTPSGGAFTWTCPALVTSIVVQVIGGGGGGGSGLATAGGGGGGGGFSSKAISVNPGVTYNGFVGIGGAINAAGGDSWFIDNTTVLSKGGSPGTLHAGGAGGASASGIGTTKVSGGAGYAGVIDPTTGVGGGGGSSGGYGSAGFAATSFAGATQSTGNSFSGGGPGGDGARLPATAATVGGPGGGGGGGGYGVATLAGKAGGIGGVIIAYNDAVFTRPGAGNLPQTISGTSKLGEFVITSSGVSFTSGVAGDNTQTKLIKSVTDNGSGKARFTMVGAHGYSTNDVIAVSNTGVPEYDISHTCTNVSSLVWDSNVSVSTLLGVSNTSRVVTAVGSALVVVITP